MTSENTNCLAGMKCPKCGSREPFGIEVTTTVTMSDDGTEDHGNCEWDDSAYCECRACYFHATAGEFRTDRPGAPVLPYSVLLLYPASLTGGNPETYFAHVAAAGPVEAVKAAREMAAAAQEPGARYDPDDFTPLICIAGHHEAELLHGGL